MPRRFWELLEHLWPLLLVFGIPWALSIVVRILRAIQRAQERLKEAEAARAREIQSGDRMRDAEEVAPPPTIQVTPAPKVRKGAEPKDLVTYLGELITSRESQAPPVALPPRVAKQSRPRVRAAPPAILQPRKESPARKHARRTPSDARREATTSVQAMSLLQLSRAELRKAIIWNEVLSPPISLRDPREGPARIL